MEHFERKKVLGNVYAARMTQESETGFEATDPKKLIHTEHALLLKEYGRSVVDAITPGAEVMSRISGKVADMVIPVVTGNVLTYAYGHQHALNRQRVTGVSEGDRVQGWKVLETPGHTTDETALQRSGVLVSGDLVTVVKLAQQDFLLSLNLLSTGANLDHALGSLRKLATAVEKDAVDLMIPQHGPFVRGHQEIMGRLQRALTRYESMQDDARKALGENRSRRISGEDIRQFHAVLKSKNIILGRNTTEEMMVVFHLLRSAQN